MPVVYLLKSADNSRLELPGAPHAVPACGPFIFRRSAGVLAGPPLFFKMIAPPTARCLNSPPESNPCAAPKISAASQINLSGLPLNITAGLLVIQEQSGNHLRQADFSVAIRLASQNPVSWARGFLSRKAFQWPACQFKLSFRSKRRIRICAEHSMLSATV